MRVHVEKEVINAQRYTGLGGLLNSSKSIRHVRAI